MKTKKVTRPPLKIPRVVTLGFFKARIPLATARTVLSRLSTPTSNLLIPALHSSFEEDLDFTNSNGQAAKSHFCSLEEYPN